MVLCSTMVPQFTQTTRESLLSSSRPPHAGHAPLDDMMNTTSRSHHVVNPTPRGGGGQQPTHRRLATRRMAASEKRQCSRRHGVNRSNRTLTTWPQLGMHLNAKVQQQHTPKKRKTSKTSWSARDCWFEVVRYHVFWCMHARCPRARTDPLVAL